MKYQVMLSVLGMLSLPFIACAQTSTAGNGNETVIAKEQDPQDPNVALKLPPEQSTPMMQPYVTDSGQKAVRVTPGILEPYSIIPSETEHPDPLDDSAIPANDAQWDLLSW